MTTTEEKMQKVFTLNDEQWAKVIIKFGDLRQRFIEDVNDMIINQYNTQPLFWKHISDPNWQEYINLLTTPLQREMLQDCPMSRDIFLELNRSKKTNVDGFPVMMWWKKWRNREVLGNEVSNVYETAQKTIHQELMTIVRKFDVNMDNRGKEPSKRCKLPEAQLEFPKAVHRKLFNDMAHGIVEPNSFKYSFFDCIAYIQKYKPKANDSIETANYVFSGGYFLNGAGSDVAQ